MKQIIEGKRYDTETAELIKSWSNGLGQTDFKCRIKKLYRTKSGKYFLYHWGGAMTDMSETFGNSSCEGDSIEPVSEKDAFNFLISHNGITKAEELFPSMIQDA